MEYSRIVSIELENFMAYSHATLVFDEEGIINIKGYNGSGKSTVLRAVMVCLSNMFVKEQVKFIRHGEDYFRIIITFSDGVSLVRDKYLNGQSLYEMYRDGRKIFTTKEGSRLTGVFGVPELIEKYLGLCVTEIGCLNYMTRDTRMWLVETKGSENYYSLHEALRTEEIARANSLINSDKNELGSQIVALESDLQESTILLNNCLDVSEDFISTLEQREDVCQGLCSRSDQVDRIQDTSRKYLSLQQLPIVEGVSLTRLKRIERIEKLLKNLSSLPALPKVNPIEVSGLSRVHSISQLFSGLFNLDDVPKVESIDSSKLRWVDRVESNIAQFKKSESVKVPDIIPTINAKQIKSLERLSAIIKKYTTIDNEFNILDTDLTNTKMELDSAVDEAKQHGMQYVKCENCGSYMEMKVGV